MKSYSILYLLWAQLLFSVVLSVQVCAWEFPLARTDPSKTKPFIVDLSKPFHFELGRGSGWMGLDTIAFGEDGIVTLHRQVSDARWKTATVRLELEAIKRVFDAVRSESIMKMPAAYHADVEDGSQWVLWIRQGALSKSVYFNNFLPEGVRNLAGVVDAEITRAGISNARWSKVPDKQFRQHEKALWNSRKLELPVEAVEKKTIKSHKP
jgi:hypothetical protein